MGDDRDEVDCDFIDDLQRGLEFRYARFGALGHGFVQWV